MRSKKLVDSYLAGSSAKYLVDALIDDLPSESQIRSTLLSLLPRGSRLKFVESTVCIYADEDLDDTLLNTFDALYPELEFVQYE
jgi:hypothetical protein